MNVQTNHSHIIHFYRNVRRSVYEKTGYNNFDWYRAQRNLLENIHTSARMLISSKLILEYDFRPLHKRRCLEEGC